MSKQSSSQKRSLREAASDYNADLPGTSAAEYLEGRGINERLQRKFGLGFVDDPHPGHEMYRGMISIPYIRYMPVYVDGEPGEQMSVVSLRFRCFVHGDKEHTGHGKYNTMPGDRPRLYNTTALTEESDIVAITEGEFDAIIATGIGVPAVGIPGATSWKPHFKEPFMGYETVYVLSDGDEAGSSFGDTIAKSLPNAKVMPCPPGYDVASLVQEFGPDSILERLK